MISKRLLSSTNSLLRIGKSVRMIPEEYDTPFFSFMRNIENKEIYSPKLKLFLHLNEGGVLPSDRILLVEGLREVDNFVGRLRFLLKWGHFFWRLSDLKGLRLEPVRIVKPSDAAVNNNNFELKIHWQLKVNQTGQLFYIDGKSNKMTLPNLLRVQFHRLFPTNLPASSNPKSFILYTGINRYVFDESSGFCKELHVERIEPKISGIDWKWRLTKGSEFSGQVT